MKKLSYLIILMTSLSFSALAQAAEEAHGTTHSINVMSDLVYPWINFIILLTLLIYFLRKPAKDFFLARSKKVAQEIEQSAHEKHEAESQYLNYDRRLKNIEGEMDKLLQAMKQEGELARSKIVQEAQDAAKRMTETTQWIANQEIRKAKLALKEKAVQIISEQAGQMVKANVQDKDRQNFVSKALNNLEVGL